MDVQQRLLALGIGASVTFHRDFMQESYRMAGSNKCAIKVRRDGKTEFAYMYMYEDRKCWVPASLERLLGFIKSEKWGLADG